MGQMVKTAFLNRANLDYIEYLYELYLTDPSKLDPEWEIFFEGMNFAQNLDRPSSLSKKDIDVHALIDAYRIYGHLDANINPLEPPPPTTALQLSRYNLSEKDLEKTFDVGSNFFKPRATLQEIVDHLKTSYCSTLAVQVSETIPQIREWFIHEFEGKQTFSLSKDEKKQILDNVIKTEALENFLHMRFVGMKRFSIEGADATIPMLEWLVQKGRGLGMEELVVGMAHRGRINVLANFLKKALDHIFAEFDGKTTPTAADHDGDVKYHLGFSADKDTPHGSCHISLAFNPSHLEAATPVALGMVRAKQRVREDTEKRKKVVPIVIHGDAAFAGQGVVSETMQLANLPGYSVGGTIHLIINNQVGFTANPDEARSTLYPSDVYLSTMTPVLHVNGDDVEACVRAMDMAIRFRQRFGQDVVINMVCYRRFGHNESDEPAFTQPLMYQFIKKHPTLRKLTAAKYVADGVVTADEAEQSYKDNLDRFQGHLDKARKDPPEMKPIAFQGLWQGLRKGTREDCFKPVDTTVKLADLKKVGDIITTYPQSFSPNSKIVRLLERRKKMIAGEESLDWGMAELLAYGSLINDGTPVRVSGQDSVRGTFTHRHGKFYDSETGEDFNPLNQINGDQQFCVYNSPLSEYAVLGFEYGNAISDPTYLTVWEAQFGDFANTGQVIIDQFIVGGETKWYRMNGLVLLLPHGYEGQGPEHSSARLERFLQMCAQENMFVSNLTTPAQIFHALRRQIKRDFRKPLVVMSPKSLLRHPQAVSSMDELANGTFHEVLDDPTKPNPKKVKRVILTSGKLYFDLDKERQETKNTHTAIIRLEQYYPFPTEALKNVLKDYPHFEEIYWAQEEPSNMGAEFFMTPKIYFVLSDIGKNSIPLTCIAREEKASPATGSPLIHKKQQEEIIKACIK